MVIVFVPLNHCCFACANVSVCRRHPDVSQLVFIERGQHCCDCQTGRTDVEGPWQPSTEHEQYCPSKARTANPTQDLQAHGLLLCVLLCLVCICWLQQILLDPITIGQVERKCCVEEGDSSKFCGHHEERIIETRTKRHQEEENTRQARHVHGTQQHKTSRQIKHNDVERIFACQCRRARVGSMQNSYNRQKCARHCDNFAHGEYKHEGDYWQPSSVPPIERCEVHHLVVEVLSDDSTFEFWFSPRRFLSP